MYANYEAWWSEQSRKGDPARNPHLVRDAFNAGRADYADAHKALTLELQQHKRCHEEVMRLADRLRKYEPGSPMVLNHSHANRLDKALTVCRAALRVIESSAYQGVSDEDCDLETSVRNWQSWESGCQQTLKR